MYSSPRKATACKCAWLGGQKRKRCPEEAPRSPQTDVESQSGDFLQKRVSEGQDWGHMVEVPAYAVAEHGRAPSCNCNVWLVWLRGLIQHVELA